MNPKIGTEAFELHVFNALLFKVSQLCCQYHFMLIGVDSVLGGLTIPDPVKLLVK